MNQILYKGEVYGGVGEDVTNKQYGEITIHEPVTGNNVTYIPVGGENSEIFNCYKNENVQSGEEAKERNISTGQYSTIFGKSNKELTDEDKESKNNFIIGYNNIAINNQNNFIGGTNNFIKLKSNSSLIYGDNNYLANCEKSNFILGDKNSSTTNNSNNIIMGFFNDSQGNQSSNTIIGQSNELRFSGTGNVILGQSNKITNGGNYLLVSGSSNHIETSCDGSFVCGVSNEINNDNNLSSYKLMIGGEKNQIKGTTLSIIYGFENTVSSAESSAIFGQENTVEHIATSGMVSGDNNTVNNMGKGCHILGTGNIIGTSNSCTNGTLVCGDANTVDNSDATFVSGNGNNALNFVKGILGGLGNRVTGNYSIICGNTLVGGVTSSLYTGHQNNIISLNDSLLSGSQIKISSTINNSLICGDTYSGKGDIEESLLISEHSEGFDLKDSLALINKTKFRNIKDSIINIYDSDCGQDTLFKALISKDDFDNNQQWSVITSYSTKNWKLGNATDIQNHKFTINDCVERINITAFSISENQSTFEFTYGNCYYYWSGQKWIEINSIGDKNYIGLIGYKPGDTTDSIDLLDEMNSDLQVESTDFNLNDRIQVYNNTSNGIELFEYIYEKDENDNYIWKSIDYTPGDCNIIGSLVCGENLKIYDELKHSMVVGYSNNICGEYKYCLGQYLNTENQNGVDFITGEYNNTITNGVFSIGNGIDDNNRSNAFEVYKDGCQSIILKEPSQALVNTLGIGKIEITQEKIKFTSLYDNSNNEKETVEFTFEDLQSLKNIAPAQNINNTPFPQT